MTEHRTIEVDGVSMLAIKWQDDEQQPAVRIMAKVSFVFAEFTAGFATEEARDRVYDNDASELFTSFASIAKQAVGA